MGIALALDRACRLNNFHLTLHRHFRVRKAWATSNTNRHVCIRPVVDARASEIRDLLTIISVPPFQVFPPSAATNFCSCSDYGFRKRSLAGLGFSKFARLIQTNALMFCASERYRRSPRRCAVEVCRGTLRRSVAGSNAGSVGSSSDDTRRASSRPKNKMKMHRADERSPVRIGECWSDEAHGRY